MKSEKIIELCLIHDGTDYSDPGSVNNANRAADQIAILIESLIDLGKVEKLLSLLNHESAGPWVAFKMAESAVLSKGQKETSIMKIKEISQGENINAVGAELWLKENGYTDS